MQFNALPRARLGEGEIRSALEVEGARERREDTVGAGGQRCERERRICKEIYRRLRAGEVFIVARIWCHVTTGYELRMSLIGSRAWSLAQPRGERSRDRFRGIDRDFDMS